MYPRSKNFMREVVVSGIKCSRKVKEDKDQEVAIGFGNMKVIGALG